MRAKLWNILPEDTKITKKMEISVNVLITLLWLVIQMFNVDVSTLIGLVGALGAFLGVYLFPILIHLKCIYSKPNRMYSSNYIQGNLRETIREEILPKHNNRKDHAKACRGDSLYERLSVTEKSLSCTSTHSSFLKTPKWLRLTFYSLITAIGIALIVVRISALV